jgi:hypothetical protein
VTADAAATKRRRTVGKVTVSTVTEVTGVVKGVAHRAVKGR